MDLTFQTTHDENGIPICCMTCAKWTFAKGKSCDVIDVMPPCSGWVISEHYKNKAKEGSDGANKSKAP